MAGVLVLGPHEKTRIAEAIAKARLNPMPWEVGEMIADGSDTMQLDLGERKANIAEVRARYPSQHLTLGTYEVSLSFHRQPAGLLRQLSLSTRVKGKVPGLEVLTAVLLEFGFSGVPLQRPGRVWTEEFRPGHYAINVVELEPET